MRNNAMETLNNLPVEVDLKEVRSTLHLERNRDLQLLQRMIDKAAPLIEPKAAFKLCYIEKYDWKAKCCAKTLIRLNDFFPMW